MILVLHVFLGFEIWTGWTHLQTTRIVYAVLSMVVGVARLVGLTNLCHHGLLVEFLTRQRQVWYDGRLLVRCAIGLALMNLLQTGLSSFHRGDLGIVAEERILVLLQIGRQNFIL